MTDDRPTISPDRAALVERAALWLADEPYQSKPVPLLRERFGLSTAEACQAIGRANQMRACRGAFA